MSTLLCSASADLRIEAFRSPTGREVFHSICHAKEIGMADPFDVRSIHGEVRDVFESMIARATTPPGMPSGRSLLLVGESGSGKTHLMRAFRNYVHARGLGYCGYLQMTTPTHNYGRYILSRLLTSLDESYDDPRVPLSSLMCLSGALADSLGPDYASVVEELRIAHFRADELAELVHRLSKDILEGLEHKAHRWLDTIQALVYLQRQDSAVRAAAHSFLRCDDLSPLDCEALGGIVPRKDDSHPMEMIESLGYLMWAVGGRPLVLFVDQLEEMYNLENAKELFRRAMSAINTVVENVPSSTVVIACLEDYYDQLNTSLNKSLIDRIERDPDKMRLESRRGEQEIIDLVSCRLAVLYEDAGLDIDRADATFPIPLDELRQRCNLRTRDVLDWCRQFQRCFDGENIPLDAGRDEESNLGEPNPDVAQLEEQWQTFLAEPRFTVPADEDKLAGIVAAAIAHCNGELKRQTLEATAHGRFVDLKLADNQGRHSEVLIGISNKRPQGGALSKQVAELEALAATRGRFMVRSMEFPSNPKTQISRELGDYLARGGRRAVIEDSQWRAMLAFEDFRQTHGDHAGFAAWLSLEKPLTRLRPLREMLEINDRPNAPIAVAFAAMPPGNGATRAAMKPTTPETTLAPCVTRSARLNLGISIGLHPTTIEMDVDELTRHAAFLGGSGSGKTTIALHLIEQLVQRGVPAVLIDRKGDLCRYADADWWNEPATCDDNTARKRALRHRVAAELFTPGNPRGHSLSLSIVPAGLCADRDFDQLASAAGASLAGMIGLGSESRYGAQRAILIHAIKQLALLRPDQESGLAELVDLIDSEDPSLVNAIGKLDTRHFKKIVQGLETLRLNRGYLFDASAERLDFSRWLAATGDGRTRLTIVSTKFLGDTLDVQFWIAQFLNELRRWAGNHPAAALQAVFLFDEADVYLPAKSQPASKAPMEDLLKRGRSAGIGLMLATQSPGDLDYKCRENIRSWFLGRIKEDTAIGKLKPMLASARGNVAAKLPSQQPGEFQLVRDGDVVSLKAARSLMPTQQLADDAILRLASP
jgi:hypothetical protein